jgi:hypothetical protein
MFDREITLNRFLLGSFDQVVADIPADRLAERPPGSGHPPVWVLGHLAIVAEMGQTLLGGQLQHPQWMPLFGPGSSDDVTTTEGVTKDHLVQAIRAGYLKVSELLVATPTEVLNRPHGVTILDGTPIETVADIEAHLLTTHFAFHLAQLSGWRRAAGLGPLI